MSDLQNIKVTTPIGKQEVELRPFATGRIMQAIQEALYGEGEVTAGGEGEAGNVSFKMANITKSTNVALQSMILSIDGDSSNVLDKVLDMHEKDTAFIKTEVDKLTEQSGLDKKK